LIKSSKYGNLQVIDGGVIPFPQKNSLPRRVQISFQDFAQKMFELRPKNTALTTGQESFGILPCMSC